MRNTDTVTISLHPAMAKQMQKVQKEENRTRSELLPETWKQYFENRYPIEIATKAEIAAIRGGRAEMKADRFVTLTEITVLLSVSAQAPTPDVFLHCSQISPFDESTLEKGVAVKFEDAQAPRDPFALCVTRHLP